MKQRIHFRVDANNQIGYGHFIRCISIAHALTDHECTFYSSDNLSQDLEKHFADTTVIARFSPAESFLNAVRPNDVVIVDGYHFDAGFIREIRSKQVKIVRIDDLADEFLDADLIINHTPSFDISNYRTPVFTQFCLGLNFAMLRPPFLEIAQKIDLKKDPDSLLICFGGADPLNQTETALLCAIETALFNSIRVVLGPGYKHVENIQAIIALNPSIELHQNIGASEMLDLMASSEYAVLPSSGILLEGLAAQMKIISGFAIENQKHVYSHHLKMGSFTDAQNFSSEHIKKAMIEVKNVVLPQKLVDGASGKRIKKAIELLFLEGECKLVKATTEHTKITFDWANNPEVRKYAFSQESIPWEDHENWFSNKIQQSRCWYGILEHQDQPVGSIRFDINNSVAMISYLIDPKYHGKGFGTLLIKMGMQSLISDFKTEEITEIHGEVFPSNIASIKTFDRFGFVQTEEKDVFLFIKKIGAND